MEYYDSIIDAEGEVINFRLKVKLLNSQNSDTIRDCNYSYRIPFNKINSSGFFVNPSKLSSILLGASPDFNYLDLSYKNFIWASLLPNQMLHGDSVVTVLIIINWYWIQNSTKFVIEI